MHSRVGSVATKKTQHSVLAPEGLLSVENMLAWTPPPRFPCPIPCQLIQVVFHAGPCSPTTSAPRHTKQCVRPAFLDASV